MTRIGNTLVMMHNNGFSLLELLISLAISAILFVVIDKVTASLWLTRKSLEQSQALHRHRELPQQFFADLIFHAGNLGCRAVKDGIEIRAPSNLPPAIFIHQGEAIRVQNNELWVHQTLAQRIRLDQPLSEGALIRPEILKDKSDWLLVSDCQGAEVLPYGGHSLQAYEPPVFISPLILNRWFLQNQTLSRQTVSPSHASQPVLSSVESMQWERLNGLMRLRWKVGEDWDEFIFELGNS